MKNLSPWILVLLAALVVSPLVRSKPEIKTEEKKPEQAKPEDKKPEEKKDVAPQPLPPKEPCRQQDGKEAPPECGALRVLRDFFGSEPSLSASVERAADLGDVVKAVDAAHYNLQFMVALVPDPLESGEPLRFDLTLDAIQQGFGQVGYLPDRFWLPWLSGKGSREGSTDTLYRRSPGVLLFRQRPHLAVVFLIGESPKTGIHKEAFTNALAIASRLRSVAAGPEVEILGPTFSGSAESLRQALRSWPPTAARPEYPPSWPPLSFQIATGSATGTGLERTLKDFSFCRAVAPDVALQSAGFEFLRDEMGWDLRKAALLTEADTGYGQSLLGGSKGPWDLALSRFPSHIADVRNAWEQDKTHQQAESRKVDVGKNQIVTGRPALDFDLQDREKPEVVIPNFSSLTVPTQDLALSNLLEAISREGFRYVGVMATDIKDRLFLIQKIRQFSPGTVIFTFDNDLLLAHPTYGQDMDGVVVISSAPLFTEGASWLPSSSVVGGRQRRQFVEELQQGIFEAVRHLMGSWIRVRPQVWVSTVGNGASWPMAHLEAMVPPSVNLCGNWNWRQAPRLSERESRLAGKSNLQMLLFAGVLCALSVGLRRIGLLYWKRIDGTAFSRPVNPGLVGLGNVVLVLSAGVLLVVASVSEWAPVLSEAWRWPSWTWSKSLFLLLLVAAYVYLVYQAIALHLDRDRWQWSGVSLLAPVLLVPIIFWLWIPGGQIALFQLRARTLGSGLSPLVALTLLAGALYVWILCELKRRLLVERQVSGCPLDVLCEASLAGCEGSVKIIGSWLGSILPPEAWCRFLLGGIFLPVGAFLWESFQPIAESKAYGRFFLLFLLTVSALAALSFFRFVRLWIALRAVLRRFDHASPQLLATFESLSSEVEWKPMKSFGLQFPPFTMLVLSVRKLRLLIKIGSVEIKDPTSLLEKVFEQEAKGNSSNENWYRFELETVFQETCTKLKGKTTIPEVREFLAVRTIAYFRYVFAHLRSCLMGAIGAGLLILLAVAAYFFEPKPFVSLAVWVSLGIAVALTFWIFLQMDRNATLSRIGGTKPGEINFDKTFSLNLLLYVIVPLLGVIATQFPEIGRLLGSLADDVFRISGGS